ncbi:MFS transporter [Lentzea flaviverrucosa]|uniref:Predicted arabinose efflux permease, MFS family n=1 Tax=Lentzea flaviverrucosa TaxID=200379 RepID=A0A1H9H4V8_9PSEU|nr:MFS transporter [Lentzea flaviverrucosa]RDI34700.1 putative MFS family arabinose efflux permease [Lentzea flaviverrucosa]SEQ57384.1 Predicted arabinose efflux permease, MFS family [Lentzea flaviverrucosa]
MSQRASRPEKPGRRPGGSLLIDGERPAGRSQALVLLLASCLPVLGSVLLAPVLPAIQQAFASTPGASVLTPIVLTAPALMIGLTAPFAGRVVERTGRKRLLVAGLVAYGIFGTAPLWLPTLELVVASRVLVGVAEAAIMTCCTTLLADYFHGKQRQRYFGLQTVCTTVAATLFFALGGLLGAQGWRTPFWLYAASLPLAVMAVRYLWEPADRQDRGGTVALAWRLLAAPIGVTLVGGLVFYTLIVELPYVLSGVGVVSTATIGMISALASLATAAGAFLFTPLAHRGPGVTVTLAFLLSGIGLAVLAFAPSTPVVVVGAAVTGLGNGLLLPALVTWALGRLTFAQRPRASGLWTAALFIGQFVCPLVVLALSVAVGGLSSALLVIGALAVLLSVITRAVKSTDAKPVPADG